jgi:hypothetical protein
MTKTETTTFEPGSTYAYRWVTDHTTRTLVTVTDRTAKFVTIQHADGISKRRGVTIVDGEEIIYPLGRYGMCPILRASSLVPMHCAEFVPAPGGAHPWCDTCGWRADLHESPAKETT